MSFIHCPGKCEWHAWRCLHLKNRFSPKVMCLMEFWRCDSLGVCSKRACNWCGVHEILRRRCPALVNRNRVFLQQDNGRPHTARTTVTKIQELGRNRTAITPNIQPWSCAFRLPSVSIQGPFLVWKKFRKYWSCGSESHWSFASKTRDRYLCAIINFSERWLKTIQSDGLYFEE